MTMPSQPIRILLVENDDVDAEAFERGMRKHRISSPLFNAPDGAKALRLLRAESAAPSSAGQLIVLLDLNLPRMSGLEFLAFLRADPALKDTIVFALTSSAAAQDRVDMYRVGVTGYFVKSNMGPCYDHIADLLEDAKAADIPELGEWSLRHAH